MHPNKFTQAKPGMPDLRRISEDESRSTGDKLEDELGQKIPYGDGVANMQDDLDAARAALARLHEKSAAALKLLAGIVPLAVACLLLLPACVSVESVSVGYNAQTGASEVRVATRPKPSGKEVVEEPLPPMPQAEKPTRSRILSDTAKRLMGLAP